MFFYINLKVLFTIDVKFVSDNDRIYGGARFSSLLFFFSDPYSGTYSGVVGAGKWFMYLP